MNKSRILVLGNSPFINQIEFERISKNVKTFGVNRIWLKHIPDYFFFHDPEILNELDQDTINKLSKGICFTSDWLKTRNLPFWLRRFSRLSRIAFPDSVTTGLSILRNDILKGEDKKSTFYIAGVSLRWEEPSHFWKENGYTCTNTFGKSWYAPRFNKIMKNFLDLKYKGFDIVSVTPNSELNNYFDYVPIDTLYR